MATVGVKGLKGGNTNVVASVDGALKSVCCSGRRPRPGHTETGFITEDVAVSRCGETGGGGLRSAS